MITTVIPFLLVANLSDNLDWSHGPEFNFQFDVSFEIKNADKKNSEPHVFNVTNHILCIPNGENVLSCGFNHKDMMATRRNRDAKDQIVNPSGGSLPQHQEIRFEMNFNKHGVESITIPSISNKDYRPLIYKSWAKMFNTGVDLSTLKYEHSPDEHDGHQMMNFLLGKCMTHISAKYTDSLSEQNILNDELSLMAPLKPIPNGKYFNLNKLANTSDCEHYTHFYWGGMVMRDLHDDPSLNITRYYESIQVSKNSFTSENVVHMERKINDVNLLIFEHVKNNLIDISPARDKAPAIEDPVTLPM